MVRFTVYVRNGPKDSKSKLLAHTWWVRLFIVGPKRAVRLFSQEYLMSAFWVLTSTLKACMEPREPDTEDTSRSPADGSGVPVLMHALVEVDGGGGGRGSEGLEGLPLETAGGPRLPVGRLWVFDPSRGTCNNVAT